MSIHSGVRTSLRLLGFCLLSFIIIDRSRAKAFTEQGVNFNGQKLNAQQLKCLELKAHIARFVLCSYAGTKPQQAARPLAERYTAKGLCCY